MIGIDGILPFSPGRCNVKMALKKEKENLSLGVILPRERKRNMPTSKRSFGLILLHVAVCSVGRKLTTSSCLPVRNKIRFSTRQFPVSPMWLELANSPAKILPRSEWSYWFRKKKGKRASISSISKLNYRIFKIFFNTFINSTCE